MKKKNVFLCVLLLFLLPSAYGQKKSLVNFGHLEHLTENITLGGQEASIVHVYANFPAYEWVGAAETGQEGIACVDDAARAAVLYLRHFELTQDSKSRQRALSLLRFVMKMQAEDGQFFNFVMADHSINSKGETSFKSFGWWAARGVWAMATGYRVLARTDSLFAIHLREGVIRALPYIDILLKNRGEFRTVDGCRIPRWLLYESGSDATSELLFGLIEYERAAPDSATRAKIVGLSEGLMAMQEGSAKEFPFGLHRSWQSMWHMWGNGQTQALAWGGKVLKSTAMVRSAELEARAFYPRLLMQGFMKEMDVATSRRTPFQQIAYCVRPMSVGLLRLFDATNDSSYLVMAGLAASWLFGNNVAGIEMYNAATGRCFDGINDSVSVNRNSGAESTIEALATVVELEQYPFAAAFMSYRKVQTITSSDRIMGKFRNAAGNELRLILDLETGRVSYSISNDKNNQ